MRKNLSWKEAIEAIVTDNGGSASLDKMYAEIEKYRDISTNKQWQATMRGILYRDVLPEGKVVKVGLGVYGLANSISTDNTFQKIVKNQKTSLSPRHASTQGMLLELGNFYGYHTYTADPNAAFDGKNLSSIASLSELPEFTFPDLWQKARKVDVIWLNRKGRPFPQFAFEVENTPEFSRSLHKLYQFRHFATELFIIAEAGKKPLFLSKLNDDPLHELKNKFIFKTFDAVLDLYVAAARHFVLKEQFFAS